MNVGFVMKDLMKTLLSDNVYGINPKPNHPWTVWHHLSREHCVSLCSRGLTERLSSQYHLAEEMRLLGEKVTQCLRILMAKCNGVKIIEDDNNSLQKIASNVGG